MDLELIVNVLPRIESPIASFVKNAKLRPDSEIKAFNNSIYEMHWSVRDAYLNGREPPDDLHPVVVYQRHRAANWLCPEVVDDSPSDDVMTENLENLREREWQLKSLVLPPNLWVRVERFWSFEREEEESD